MSIRPARDSDVLLLSVMANRMHTEAPAYAAFSFNAGKVVGMLQHLIRGGGCLLVSEIDGVVRGGIAGICSSHWFSDDRIATDLALFVDREYRNGTTALRLVAGFIEWARLAGAKRVNLGITTGITPEATARLYVAAGLTPSGSIFSKDF